MTQIIVFFISLFSINLYAEEQFQCSVKYDDLEIPHQRYSSEEEFFFCFGCHHGQDRAWQMDYFRRLAQGKNAEVLGFSHLKNDLMMKLLDLPKEAEKIWKSFNENEKKFLKMYSDGVNKGFKKGENSKEFIDLNYRPEPWRPQDSLTVLLLQSFDQTRKTFFRDYLENKMSEDWGKRAPELFEHDDIPWENTILKEGEYSKKATFVFEKSIQRRKLVNLWSKFPSMLGEESGSNNWVISKRKSKSGHAILANDPHLDLKTPLFWYWIHLKSKQDEVIGASLPGVPVIAAGTNGKVAWGLTNAYLKTAEAVFLKPTSSDEIDSFWPTVWVKFGPIKFPFFFKRFERLNKRWPVLPLETNSDQPLILSWTGFHLSSKDITQMFNFYKVKNVKEINEVLKQVGVPAWNFVFADTHGDIGYRMVGKSFRISEKKPWGIVKKTSKEISQLNLLERNELPHVLKPKRNYIHTANNRHWPKDSKYDGGRGYSHGFRGFRIEERLDGKQDIESLQGIQCDLQVTDAKFLVPKLLTHLSFQELSTWNMNSDDDSVEMSLYLRFIDIIFDRWKIDEYAFFRILEKKLSPNQILDLKDFYEEAKKDVSGRRWSEFHQLDFQHLSQNEDWVFSPVIQGLGDTHTVNPGTAKWNDEKKIYQQFSGASMRLIIEMSPKPQIFLSLPGRNRNYYQKENFNPWDRWRKCHYSKVSF